MPSLTASASWLSSALVAAMWPFPLLICGMDEVLSDLQAAAVEAHTTRGLRDLSRMDFVVDDEGTCWFIDANVAPGMTDTSLLPQAADALEDSSFAQLCADIVDFVAGGRDVHSFEYVIDEEGTGVLIDEDTETTEE